jgi:hypothetical protein
MTSRIIEDNMRFVRLRLKWLIFGRRVGTCGGALCFIWLLVQLAAIKGVFTQLWLLNTLIALMAVAVMLCFTVACAISFGAAEKRSRIGSALELSRPALMDRVNTLIYLEDNPRKIRSLRLRGKIEEQAETVILAQKPTFPFSPNQTLTHLGIFVLLLVATILVQQRCHPFKGVHGEDANVAAKPSTPFELAPQKDVTEAAPKKSWGGVRIVDPGRDVRLTKVDVLPLQIEMTSSDTLRQPVWVTSINGGDEAPHDLTAPTDPHYMVYQPMIYLDQLQVTEWDVISYYAKVQSDAPAQYASPLNFIEIRPFREDILKITGKDGKGNKRYQMLSELTGLIKQQTQLMQDTHQHLETTYAKDELRLQDAHKLSASEAQLATATNHFYGEVAANSENTPVGDILDQLSQAEEEMNRATSALQDDVAQEGKQREQAALTHLIACRKAFQKVISDHPDAFGGDNSSDALSDQTPTATDSLKALGQVSEMRNRNKEALQALHDLTEREKQLAAAPGMDNQTAKSQQTKLKSDFHDLMDKNPDLFHPSSEQEAAVQQNMTDAIIKMSSNDKSGGNKAMSLSADSLKDLESAVNKRLEGQQMEQAYKLKKIIDQNAKQLSQEQSQPGSLTPQQVQDLANSAQHSTSTLKDIVDSGPTSGFGPQLGKALSAENQQALHNALNQFVNASSGLGRAAPAGAAQKGLEQVSQAFDQSQPDLTNKLRGQDQLQPAPSDALDQATEELQSMILAGQTGHAGSPDQQDKALAQILGEIEAGTSDGKFGGIVHDKLMADAKDLMKQKTPGEGTDPEKLKKLLDEIESVRVEANDAHQPKPPELNTTQIDPAKFPPAYRERLKTYFEQLSQPSH